MFNEEVVAKQVFQNLAGCNILSIIKTYAFRFR